MIYTGGAFGDTLAGGTGAGHHVLRNTQVQVIELPGGGEDTAWVEVDGYTIAADVEIGRL